MCKLHDTRRRRSGDPLRVIPQRDRDLPRGEGHPHWAGDSASYSAVHQRMARARGRASAHMCACGARAAQWAYDHADPNEKPSQYGPYSTDPAHYFPSCTSCHKKFDMERIRNASQHRL